MIGYYHGRRPNIPPMATDRKTEPKLAEATAKTAAVLETLRSRLNREAAKESLATEPPEVPDELGRQLEQYFAAAPVKERPANGLEEVRIPNEIRAQVIDGVVDRILRSWGAPSGEIPASIKSEVIARLVEHVLSELLKKGANPR
jgi:uncharacterized protein (DUF2267 family)